MWSSSENFFFINHEASSTGDKIMQSPHNSDYFYLADIASLGVETHCQQVYFSVSKLIIN